MLFIGIECACIDVLCLVISCYMLCVVLCGGVLLQCYVWMIIVSSCGLVLVIVCVLFVVMSCRFSLYVMCWYANVICGCLTLVVVM